MADADRVLLKAKRRTPNKTVEQPSLEHDNLQILEKLDLNHPTQIEEEMQALKDDDNVTASCRNAIVSLSNNLKIERAKNDQSTKCIEDLQQKVSSLTTDLETSKHWQNSAYIQMQKMTEFNNEMSKKVAELHSMVHTLQTSKNSASKSAVKENEPVVYGDSASAKKIAQRRTLKASGKQKDEVKSESKIADQLKAPTEIILVEDTEPEEMEEVEAETESIEETLRQAAESVVLESGFTYDETSGMYYNWKNKMYYDPSSKLYYDHENGIYYYYDQEKQNYIFHSQISVGKTDGEDAMSTDVTSKKPDDELSDGEIRSDVSSDGDSAVVVVDPCVRIIVVKSETLDVGTLFIITCQGGNVGRDSSNNICLAEEMVSRSHAKIIYEKDLKTFFIHDLNTINGTFINDERIADPKASSDPIEITHRDYVQVGSTTMSFHVHIGKETCFDCEPGNIQAILDAKKSPENDFKEDLNKQRKHEMKSMMKKYGLSKGYMPKKLLESIPDRAGRRRKEVGSDAYENASKPVEKASVNKEISEENLGHKMLSKMGWKSGEGLGKSQQGIAQPIGVKMFAKNKGLGFGQTSAIDTLPSKKQDILNKTKERFNKINS